MTDYKEFLVPIEIAEALKKIGFDEDDEKIVKLYEYKSKEIIEPTWEFHYRCNYFRHFLSHRDEYCPLFTYEQVFAWFREKGLYGNIEAGSKYNSIYIFSDNDLDMGSNIYPTYEEAREELLKRLIKIYKENI
jgi:hypothetical protein|nr:MAG TPA: hypothetical protein [Caudoviricetes sp.]DAS14848.1 MAG TPA: hypothetical protein [Caudoviricetes sp.]